MDSIAKANISINNINLVQLQRHQLKTKQICSTKNQSKKNQFVIVFNFLDWISVFFIGLDVITLFYSSLHTQDELYL